MSEEDESAPPETAESPSEEEEVDDDRSRNSSDQQQAGDLGSPTMQSTVFTMNRMLGVDVDVDLQDLESEDSPEESLENMDTRQGQEEETSDVTLSSGETSSFGEKYVLADELGEGRMGRVLEAEDVDIRREVAVKVLQDQDRQEPDKVKRFLEEAQVQGQLEHPTIPPVFEIGMGEGSNVFISMQKIQGNALQEILDRIQDGDPRTREEFSLSRLLQIFRKICDGLAYAHSRGVIHRDIKPENIMIGDYGEVHIMDWGLAKVTGYDDPHKQDELVVSDQREDGTLLSRSGSVIGTPAYMSPEQARGEVEHLDERADIYALGGILYRMLTLEPPVEAEDVEEALEKVRNNEIQPPRERAPEREIPEELESVAMKALSKQPADRYRTAEEMGEDITAFLEGRALKAANYNPVQLLWKWLLYHKTTSVSALVLVVSTAVFFGYRSYERNARYRRFLNEAREAKEAGKYRKAARSYMKAGELSSTSRMKKQQRFMKTRSLLEDYRKEVREGDRRMKENNYEKAIESFENAVEIRRELNTGTLLKQGWITRRELKEVRGKRRKATKAKKTKEAEELMTAANRIIEEVREIGNDQKKVKQLRRARHKMWNAVELAPEKQEWQKRLEDLSRRVSALEMARLSRELRLIRRLFGRIRKHEKTGKPLDPLLKENQQIQKKLTEKDTPDTWWMKGLLSFRLGQDRKATEQFRTVLEKNPNHKLALVGLGRVLIERGITRMFWPAGRAAERKRFRKEGRKLVQEGVDTLEKARKQGKPDLLLRVQPSYLKRYLERHLQLGPLYRKLGNESYSELEKEIESRLNNRHKPDPDLLYLRGLVNIIKLDLTQQYLDLTEDEREQLKQATRDFSRVKEIRKGAFRAYFLEGMSEATRGNFEKASDLYSTAIKMNPEYWLGYYMRAWVRTKRKDLEWANLDYKEVIKRVPDFAPAYVSRAKIKLDQRKLQEALDDVDQALELDPDFVMAYVNRCAIRAVQAALNGKQDILDQALNDCNKAIELDPEFPRGYAARAQIYMQRGDLDRALEDVHKALEKNPNQAQAHFVKGAILNKKNQLNKALRSLRRAIELDPNLPGAYLIRSIVKEKQNNYKEALEDASRAVELNSYNVQAYVKRGLLHFRLGKLRKALEDYNQILELNPDHTRALYNKALIKQKLGQRQEALNLYSQTIELQPDNKQIRTRAYLNSGLLRQQNEQYQKAMEHYRKALDLNPNHPLIHHNIGLVHYRRGRKKKALNRFNKAIELSPDMARAYINRGLVKKDQGKYRQALTNYKKALDLGPHRSNKPNAHYGIGFIHSKLGKHEKALNHYNRAIELNPEFVEAYMGRGRLKLKRKQHRAAISDFNKVIKRNPNHLLAYVNRGWAKQNLGDLQAAIKDYQRARKQNPQHHEPFYRLGEIHRKQNKKRKAIRNYKKALERAPDNWNLRKSVRQKIQTLGG